MWECIKYLALIGITGFVIGRLIPKSWMQWNKWPYKLHDFENDGKIYTVLGIKKWQDKIPDMSRIFKKLMPPKKLPKTLSAEAISRMLQETCIAELIHLLLCFAGIYCICLWPGWGGWIVAGVYLLCNIPFILVQRFNRPKLQKILFHLQERICTPDYGSKECQPCES